MNKTYLAGKTLCEIQSVLEPFGISSEIAGRITYWIYKRGITDWREMNNVSKRVRQTLEENFIPAGGTVVSVHHDTDGTRKYVFRLSRNRYVESVYIPDGKRETLCVSSQAGCRMGCAFCNTGQNGFAGNLTVSEMVQQFYHIPERRRLNRLVFMGMGEPMDNTEEVIRAVRIFTAEWGFALSRRHITISTVGAPTEVIYSILTQTKCNLTLSLHFPFGDQRSEYMPVERRYPAGDILAFLKKYNPLKYQRITVAYTLFHGLNDTEKHLKALITLLQGSLIRVNLIPYNRVDGLPFVSAPAEKYSLFQRRLLDAGIPATIRRSRGDSISAACGQLAARQMPVVNSVGLTQDM